MGGGMGVQVPPYPHVNHEPHENHTPTPLEECSGSCGVARGGELVQSNISPSRRVAEGIGITG